MRPRITKENRQELNDYSFEALKNDFRVFVWNHGTPKEIHASSKEALKEAARLCQKEGKKVLVVQTLFILKPNKKQK